MFVSFVIEPWELLQECDVIMRKNGITAIILTKNEERNIRNCIESIQGLADRIVVVDSGSTDKTTEIARELGAEIYTHEFIHYAAQFNWALDNTDIRTKWVYRIDADEIVPDDLREEIRIECARHAEDSVNGFLMKHKLFFLGKYLKHGGTYPFIKMTVFKPEYGRFDDRAMGEHVILSKGTYITLKNDCLHHDFKDLTQFIEKHNSYATREVSDYLKENAAESENGLYSQARHSRKMRSGFYYRLPMFLRAKLYYMYRYYFRMGFLDGKQGKIYAMLQAYMYRFIVDAKIFENEILQSQKEDKD